MKVHFIAIGGAAMHNIAIDLHLKGDRVSGSDDELFEPSRSRLEAHGLLPVSIGWFPERITSDIDLVILGMHARADNPELIRANEMGVPVVSFPEFLFRQTEHQKRVVIGGSHGKTTITSMVMHVLRLCGWRFSYMVGSQVEGFDTMAHIDRHAAIAVFEGDEYLASPVDPRPKFHLYHPHIAVISGIAWDHINVFPTFDEYKQQFKTFIQKIEPKGALIYYQDDSHIIDLVNNARKDLRLFGYQNHPAETADGKTFLLNEEERVEVPFFGRHNLQNVSAALQVCLVLGLSRIDFFRSIGTFQGARKRLQQLAGIGHCAIFSDFAHSPSKLQATIRAVKEQYPDRKLIACMELHTFSSLSKSFLTQYKGTMELADTSVVFFSPHTLKHKQLEELDEEAIREAFNDKDMLVFDEVARLNDFLNTLVLEKMNLLLMSSGNFGGLNFQSLVDRLYLLKQ